MRSAILALLPAVALAAAPTFNGVRDTACQLYNGTYATVTSARIKKLIVDEYPSAPLVDYSDREFAAPYYATICPPNSDNHFKFLQVPEWTVGAPADYATQSGLMAVIYYKQTNTYNVCEYVASVQKEDGYYGFCNDA